MPGGIEPEQLDIEGVRQPRQRMPVESLVAGESPAQGRPRQAILHMRIVGYVLVVIEIEKRMMSDGEVNANGRSSKQEANNKRSPRARHSSYSLPKPTLSGSAGPIGGRTTPRAAVSGGSSTSCTFC